MSNLFINEDKFKFLSSHHPEQTEQSSTDNWMLTYIDIFTLITIIFIVMLTFSSPINPVEGISPEVTDLLEDKDVFARKDIGDTISALGMSEFVDYKEFEAYSQIEIQGNLLFESGGAALSHLGEELIFKLVPLFEATQDTIIIEGHTDNVPMENNSYYSNWELAAARANNVIHYLEENKLNRDRLRAISYADTKPIATNDTAAGRSKNRRVSFVMQKRGQYQYH